MKNPIIIGGTKNNISINKTKDSLLKGMLLSVETACLFKFLKTKVIIVTIDKIPKDADIKVIISF